MKYVVNTDCGAVHLGAGNIVGSEKAREKMVFKLGFEGQIKVCQLEGVVSTRFPGGRSSMNKGIKVWVCGLYH